MDVDDTPKIGDVSVEKVEVDFFDPSAVESKELMDQRKRDVQRIEEFPKTSGVSHVRGCEIYELVDEEGTVISEMNPREFPEFSFSIFLKSFIFSVWFV